MSTELAQPAPQSSQMIPGDFAEKAMASLMQLHSELMDEKERRVELYRKLMEREQTVAELRMYVKLLEEKLNPPKLDVQPQAPVRPPEAVAYPVAAARALGIEVPVAPAMPSAYARAPEVAPPLPPRVARPKVEAWKTW